MSIAIIGGGASAMFLASSLKNKDVTIFEKNNKLGKKLLLTGNGKCNFTSGNFEDLQMIYNNDFARDLYKEYDNESFISFLKKLGIVAKKEIHKGYIYYYPNSNKATSVYYNLLDKIIDNGCNINYDADVIDIKKLDDKFKIILKDSKEYIFDKVVIATGGKSYQNTGSDGSGYKLAKNFSHNIISQVPGLCSLHFSGEDINKLKNIRVDATIKAYKVIGDKSELICDEQGEIQFTENCISGIPILNISRHINRLLDSKVKIYLMIDFLNADLNEDLYERSSNLSYKYAKDFLCGLIPDDIGKIVIKRAGIKENIYIENLTDKDIKNIIYHISNFKIDISGYSGFDLAQVTMGGVDINEIDNNTLMSKKVKNLYFIGEVMDIDGKCGGYNLQMAYSTAMAVARNI